MCHRLSYLTLINLSSKGKLCLPAYLTNRLAERQQCQFLSWQPCLHYCPYACLSICLLICLSIRLCVWTVWVCLILLEQWLYCFRKCYLCVLLAVSTLRKLKTELTDSYMLIASSIACLISDFSNFLFICATIGLFIHCTQSTIYRVTKAKHFVPLRFRYFVPCKQTKQAQNHHYRKMTRAGSNQANTVQELVPSSTDSTPACLATWQTEIQPSTSKLDYPGVGFSETKV